MTDCKRCGAPDGEWVCRRHDGSNGWALDLDLAVEQPKTWAKPFPVHLDTNGICRRCNNAQRRDSTL